MTPTAPREAPLRGPLPSAVVLAAGLSSRFGGKKLLAKVGGKALVQRAVEAVPPDEVAETIVVVGSDEGALGGLTQAGGARVVENTDYRTGIGSSIRAGVEAVSRDSSGVLILLADQPFVTRALVRRILGAFQAEGGMLIVAAARGRVVSPPAVFPRALFRELSRLEGDRGAKAVIERHGDRLVLARVRSKRALSDVDTREDLKAARRLLQPREPR